MSPEAAEAQEEARIAEAVRDASEFAPNDDGLRAIVTAWTTALATHDSARAEHLQNHIAPDDTRLSLVLTFDGNRALAERTLLRAPARLTALRGALAALHAPLTVTLASATGEELADGSAHGLDPHMPSLARHLRPLVRFYHVTVTASDGAHVELSPMAFSGGHWTWLGEPWEALTPAVAPTTPVAGGPQSNAAGSVGRTAR